MKTCRYVVLDPTGNLTALVLDPVLPEEEAFLTNELLKVSEQVAYLEKPALPGAAAAIRLMGGEFCGNAAMAAAAWLLRDRLSERQESAILLQVSGAKEPVPCRVQALGGLLRGTVRMPAVLGVRGEEYCGRCFTAVRMEGILHLIDPAGIPDPAEAEALLRRIVARLPDEAVGLMRWDRETGTLTPLVYVRGSGSLVWEHGCGSGSAAVGACEALLRGDGTTVTEVRQPGGTITVSAEVRSGAVTGISIAGLIRFGAEQVIRIPL